jgi:small GTP-binding protein
MGTTIGILAHVDAGKTTLSEQILYRAGVLRAPGRVDRKNSFLDYGEIERERGITVFADQAVFRYEGRTFSLIDTPGHVDFSGEMERSLRVLDCAVLVVSCAEGVQSHTETVMRLLRKRRVPTLIFLNKTDRAGADPEGVLSELRGLWGAECVDFSAGFQAGEMDGPLAERLAEMDDGLFERYCSGGYERKKWLEAARRMVAEGRLYPVFRGSALNGEGVEEMLTGLAQLAPCAEGDPEGPFAALAYKVRHDGQGGRAVYLKVTSGTLRAKDEVSEVTAAGEAVTEKVNELRRRVGSKYEPLAEARPGDLCAATGLAVPMPGDGVGTLAGRGEPFALRPLMTAKVICDGSVLPATLLGYLRELEDEEPLLGVSWDAELQEIHVRVMGEVQLEVLTELVRERYGVAVGFGPCEILYLETIASPVTGCAHFEPLRHYAEVHLRLSPGPRGSGVTFGSECSTDLLAASWQNLIRTHVFEKEHRGVLLGAPLTDVCVTLLAGRSHLKHTQGGDFREATCRAVRQALMHAESVLLEPYYDFEVETGPSLVGRVLSDIRKRNGTCDAPVQEGGGAVIRGRAPAVDWMDYPRELTAFSKGTGKISLAFGGYEPCHNAREVVARKQYEPERDTENPADSVFCSHGAGFPVKWDEAPAHMHIRL